MSKVIELNIIENKTIDLLDKLGVLEPPCPIDHKLNITIRHHDKNGKVSDLRIRDVFTFDNEMFIHTEEEANGT